MSRVPVREAVAVVVTLALIGVATRAWETAQSGWETVRHRAPPRSEREFGGVLGGRMDFALAKARRIIPRDATFAVRVGYDPPVDSSIVEAIPGLFQYWLLPRRYTPDSHSAQWVVTFHHSSETLGVPIRREIGLGPDANLVEVGL
jgi:hypothetical protein